MFTVRAARARIAQMSASSTSPTPPRSRLIGCLLAGALGDAIGDHFDGRAHASEFVIPTELRITDDTQLTLATCEAITATGAVHPEAIADRFVHWFRNRRINGIGSSTLKALTELEAGGHWALVGATGERSAGNGAAMRVAPLAFFLDPDRDTDRQTLRDVSRITHRNEEAYVGALAMVRAIRHLLAGNHLDESLLCLLVNSLPDSRVRDRLQEVQHTSPSLSEYVSRFSASGFVADSVPLAVLAAIRSADYLSGIEAIVRCGGDTDTNASMFGQLFGAAFGMDAVPRSLSNSSEDISAVRRTAEDLAAVLEARDHAP